MTARVRLFWVVLAVLLLPAVLTSAQERPSVRGSLDATSYERLPADADFHVRPASASPMAMGMADLLTDALLQAGYRIGGTAPYTLSFQLTGGVPQVGRRPNLQFDGGGGEADFDTFEFKMRFNMLRRNQPAPPRRRLLLVTVSDAGNRLVWEGRASVAAEGMDGYDIIAALAPVIVEEIGRSVYGRPVP